MNDNVIAVDESHALEPSLRHGRRSLAPQRIALSADALDFAPGLLAIQENPPGRLPRVVMYIVAILFLILVLWAIFGKLDIVASAEGRLVPQSYVKIVQPSDSGIVQDILVREGDHVRSGQTLLRMNTNDAKADEAILTSQLVSRSLQLRRIDAELSNSPLIRRSSDPDDLFHQVEAQYRERRQFFMDGMAEAQQVREKSARDHDSGVQNLAKLREVTPILKSQAEAYADMGKDGYVPLMQVRDKQREYLEKNGDMLSQESTLAGLAAAERGAAKQIAQFASKYRSELHNERIEAEGQYHKLQQDWIKQEHKTGLLELKASQAGIVKDLVTHTVGSVVSPGTVLLTLVPDEEPLVAEIMVRNDDVGFIYPGQPVKLKLATFPFQKYGMIDGMVTTIGADASDNENTSEYRDQKRSPVTSTFAYKALVTLNTQQLVAQGHRYRLVPGMQVVAEVNHGKRSVIEYLLSPIEKTFSESGRER